MARISVQKGKLKMGGIPEKLDRPKRVKEELKESKQRLSGQTLHLKKGRYG